MKKKHPLTSFREAREKRLKQMQKGGTPFEEYMKSSNASASDTTGMASMGRSYSINDYNKKWGKSTPKNNLELQKKIDSNPALKKAYEKTYGTSMITDPLTSRAALNKGDNYFEKTARKIKKKGGAVVKKSKTVKKKK
jgi:hypothetical protein